MSVTKSGQGVTVFTTGQVARRCRVAPRTVSKWFDSGRLVGYKIPGSNARRIPKRNLIKFLRENGMPLSGDLMKPMVVHLNPQGDGSSRSGLKTYEDTAVANESDFEWVRTGFDLSSLILDSNVVCIIVDIAFGVPEACSLAKSIAAVCDRMPALLFTAPNGCSPESCVSLTKAGYNEIFHASVPTDFLNKTIAYELLKL
jgi:hypothetical protein